MPIVLFSEKWDTMGCDGPGLWLFKKRPTESIPVKELWQEHHARYVRTVWPHAVHAKDKYCGIFKRGTQCTNQPIDRLINPVNPLGSRS